MSNEQSCQVRLASRSGPAKSLAAANSRVRAWPSEAGLGLDDGEWEMMKGAMLSLCKVPGLVMPEFKDTARRPAWAPEVLLRIREPASSEGVSGWIVQINQISAAKYFVNEIPYRPGRVDRCLNASVPLWRLFGLTLIAAAQSLSCSMQQAFGYANRFRVTRQWEGYREGIVMLLSAMVAHQVLSDSFMTSVVGASGLFLP